MRVATTRLATSLVVVLGMAAALTACSAADDTPTPGKTNAAGSSECIAESGATSEAVKVAGEVGAAPTVTFDFPVETKKTERTVLVKGDGDLVASGDVITASFALYNATTGAEISNSFTEGSPAEFTVSNDAILVGLVNTLQCSPIGSRVVSVIPPADMWGDAGFKDLNVEGTDSVVMVADVLEVVPPLKPAAWTENVPEVDLSGDKPVVTLPAEVPTELELAVLKEGDGKVVKATDTVTLDYQGTSWQTGEIFDQSYGSEPLTLAANGFVKGFSAALIGQKVGSTLLVTIPAADAYGTNPETHQLGGQDLLFLIEIKAVA